MKKIKEMNKTEKRAWKEVKNAFNWVVGGYENSVCDGQMEEMPSYEDIVDEIYWTVMNCTTEQGYQSSRPCDEVRFAGKEFIEECIKHLMDTEEFQYEVKHAESKQAEEPAKATKVYISIVRNKANLKTAQFEIVKIETSSKKVAEDILFNVNLAPFGNKIYTAEQFEQLTSEYLEGKGLTDAKQAVECAKIYR